MDELLLVDELSQMFATNWSAINWAAQRTGLSPVVLWEGRATEEMSVDLAYARFTVSPTLSNQGSLSNENGVRKWNNQGIISVQSFAPIQWVDGYEVAGFMAIMAKRIYQGNKSPNGVWFRNCRTNRIGSSGGWYQFNTLIEYQYDEPR